MANVANRWQITPQDWDPSVMYWAPGQHDGEDIPGRGVMTEEGYQRALAERNAGGESKGEVDKSKSSTKGKSNVVTGNSSSKVSTGGAVLTNTEQVDIKKFNDNKFDEISHKEGTVSVDGVSFNGKQIIPDEQLQPSSLKDGNEYSSLIFFPIYKISDYTRDIHNWRKQINPFGIKGCFYFKIFFNFDSNYGLLGGTNTNIASVNTARQYLHNIYNLPTYKSENLKERYRALDKFINSLKNISINTPWFFREVSNLDTIMDMPLDGEDFGEHYINIGCSEESVDMRLGTLFSLYKFACYNSIRNKEIIPANLRKFEMSILFMHVPLKKYHTAWKGLKNNKEYKEKELNFNNVKDSEAIMSVKMLTFQNCEFDVTSMTELQGDASNEAAFDLGKSLIKIKYGRVYEHRLNEFEDIGFGQDGFIYPTNKFASASVNRLDAIAEDIKVRLDSHTRKLNEADISENIYHEFINRRADIIAPGKRVNTDYFNKKIDKLKGPTFNGDNIYGNFTQVRSQYYLTKLKRGKEGTIQRGNIYGYDLGRTGLGQQRRNTKYLNKKLDNIKHGSNGESVPITLGEANSFTLDWGANALNYNNNMLNVEGNPGKAKTFFGKLAESTWQRAKSAFGY